MPTPEGTAEPARRRYAAFISYNHRDRDIARWLHRSLESYRFPSKLVGSPSKIGPLARRLPPVFRDREELAASANLAASVKEALKESASLIIVCSPDSARSKWVNEEIREFHRLDRRDEIHCLVVRGQPGPPGSERDETSDACFPPALFEDDDAEPLAADIRPGQDGKRVAQLKLIAGITGLPFDHLRQRDHARRMRRLAIAVTTLSLALALTIFLAIFAFVSRNEAIQQRDLARQKTITAERTVDFVKSMFAVADPSQAQGRDVTAREIVDLGAQRLDRELADEPEVRADLQITLGEVYTNLGLLKQGDAILRRSLAEGRLSPGQRVRQSLALAEALSWQADDEGAERAYRQALALARSKGSARADLIPRILTGLGETLGYLGKTGQAEAAIREALALDRRNRANLADIARDHEALGQVYISSNRLAAARQEYQAALDLRISTQGTLHPRTIQDLNQLGAIAYLANDAAAARGYWQRELPLAEKVLGRNHPEVAVTLNNLARIEVEGARYDRAVPMLERAIAIQHAQRSGDSAELIFPLYNMALALRAKGRVAEARQLLTTDLGLARIDKHRNTAPILIELADISCDAGKKEESLALLSEARPMMKAAYPDQPWRLGLLDYISASCRGDRKGAAEARSIVLKRWAPDTHFGRRVMRD